MDPARLRDIAACLDGIDQIRTQERQVFDAFLQLRQQTDQRIGELTANIRLLLTQDSVGDEEGRLDGFDVRSESAK